MTLHGKLRRWQSKHKLTNWEAATKLGTKERTYSDWKSGKHSPRGFALKHLLAILSVILVCLSASPGTFTFRFPSNAPSFSITNAGVEITYVKDKPEAAATPVPVGGEIIPAARRVDWTLSGIPGGIPNRTVVFKTIPVGAPLADVQTALNDCPDNQIVRLSAGDYRWSGNLDWSGANEGVVLRGDGPAKTRITFTSGGILMRHFFSEAALTTDADLSAGAAKGDTTITLASVPDWVRVGHIYLLDQLNDPAIAKKDGQEGGLIYRTALGQGERGIGQTVKVVERTSTTVTFEIPLYVDYPFKNKPQLAQSGYFATFNTPLRGCGIEDLSMDFDYTNGGAHSVKMENCDGCWIKNVVSLNSPGGCHVWTCYSYRCEIRDSRFEGSHLYDSGQGYGVAFYHMTCASRVENNVFTNLHVSMQVNFGSSGNVIAYNRMLTGQSKSGQQPGINSHGCHAFMNLFEGNAVQGKVLGDFTHGSSSHNTLFRNRIVGHESFRTKDQVAISLERYNRKWNIVGNVLGDRNWHNVYECAPGGTPATDEVRAIFKLGYGSNWGGNSSNWGADPIDVVDVYRHGNWDPINGLMWDAGTTTRTLPASLYLTDKPAWFGDRTWPLYDPTKQ